MHNYLIFKKKIITIDNPIIDLLIIFLKKKKKIENKKK